MLVVGASATGVQLADEIQRSGRQVTLAVGEHIRLPRSYRGRDIQRWLNALGILDQRIDEVDDVVRVRRVPSPQLVGTPERATLDLNALAGARREHRGPPRGRARRQRAQFSGIAAQPLRHGRSQAARLLATLDRWAETILPGRRCGAAERSCRRGSPDQSAPRARPRRGNAWAPCSGPRASGLTSPGCRCRCLTPRDQLQHQGGIVDVPGVYVLGLNFLRRRKSSFIHGAEDDVRELGEHLAAWLRRAPIPATLFAQATMAGI